MARQWWIARDRRTVEIIAREPAPPPDLERPGCPGCGWPRTGGRLCYACAENEIEETARLLKIARKWANLTDDGRAWIARSRKTGVIVAVVGFGGDTAYVAPISGGWCPRCEWATVDDSSGECLSCDIAAERAERPAERAERPADRADRPA